MRAVAIIVVVMSSLGHIEAQEPKPEEIVNRAIVAAGGAALLDKYPAGKISAKGTLFAGMQEVTVQVEQTFFMPGRSRTLISMQPRGVKQEVLHVVNGLKVRYAINGTSIPVTEATTKEFQQIAILQEIGQLTPLVRDKKFTLKLDKDLKPADLVGIVVHVKGSPDVKLGFDLKTGHLSRVSRKAIDLDTAKEGDLEQLLSDYKSFDGLTKPTRTILYQDGKKILDLKTETFAPLEKVEPREFLTEG